MSYCMINTIPDGTLEAFRDIDALLGMPGEVPDGLVARYVGQADDGLVVVALWRSKAHADRFGAERLGPVLRQVEVGGRDGTLIAFDVLDEVVAAGATP